MWGTAANPFPLLTPLTFKKGTILEFTFTDLSGAANAFSFALNGVELN
jgi:invasion protein IalB